MEYIALFRGINVGGKNIVKMADLKKLFAALNYQNVRTYIQSGNVIFFADGDEQTVEAQIRTAFVASFGFECAVMLRTRDEWTDIIKQLPFSAEEIKSAIDADATVEHLYVYFLDEPPVQNTVQQICDTYKNDTCKSDTHKGEDLLCAGKRELYLLCRQSIRDSKLSALLTKMGVPMTARNWKTIRKLSEL